MGALFGLLAAILIGCCDSATRVCARRMPVLDLILFVCWVALPVSLLVMGLPELQAPSALRSMSLALVSGLLQVSVLVLLFRALADGPVAVAVAGTASSVVFLILWNILVGEPWNAMQVAAGVGVFAAIAMAARPQPDLGETGATGPLRRTALLGLAAGFLSSLRLFLVQEANDGIGPGDALVGLRIGAVIGITLLVLLRMRVRSRALRLPRGRFAWLVVLQAVLETAAILALLYGSLHAGRIGAAVGFAAVPAASSVAARLFLGDRIGRARSGWILAVVGCVALAVAAGSRG